VRVGQDALKNANNCVYRFPDLKGKIIFGFWGVKMLRSWKLE
jgi:hypothetical protein